MTDVAASAELPQNSHLPDGAHVTSRQDNEQLLVTLIIAGQLCGIPVLAVREVLGRQAITRVPLAPPAVAGSLNLRGRIVTAIDARQRLGVPSAPSGAPMSMVVEQDGELYALLVDEVAEVVRLPASSFEPIPATLSPVWAGISDGICRLDRRLLLLLNVANLLAATGPLH